MCTSKYCPKIRSDAGASRVSIAVHSRNELTPPKKVGFNTGRGGTYRGKAMYLDLGKKRVCFGFELASLGPHF